MNSDERESSMTTDFGSKETLGPEGLSGPGGAIVLGGGAGRRMGRDKGTVDWQGRPLLTHVTRRLASGLSPIIVAVGPETPLPPLPDATRIVRDVSKHQGPLAGWRHAVRTCGDALPEWFLLIGTDQPLVTVALARTLARIAFEAQAEGAVIESEGRLQPLGAVYRRSIAERLIRDESDDRSLLSFLSRCAIRRVPEAELRSLGFDPALIAGANTPEELERLKGLVRRSCRLDRESFAGDPERAGDGE